MAGVVWHVKGSVKFGKAMDMLAFLNHCVLSDDLEDKFDSIRSYALRMERVSEGQYQLIEQKYKNHK